MNVLMCLPRADLQEGRQVDVRCTIPYTRKPWYPYRLIRYPLSLHPVRPGRITADQSRDLIVVKAIFEKGGDEGIRYGEVGPE